MTTAHNYFVYILECSDKSYYTGITNDIDVRFAQHSEGSNINAYTFKRRPLILRYCVRFDDVEHAIEFEK